MKLTLRNLGRLSEASIDLKKDLIVLTGPNNTSKTYVAHAIYGLPEGLERIFKLILDPLVPRDDSATHHFAFDIDQIIREHRELIARQLGDRYKEQLADV